MFILLVTYKKPLTEVDQYLAAHCEFLDRHYADGVFFCSGPQDPRAGGVILCRAADRAVAEALTREDPFCIHGVADYAIIGFAPTKCAPDFEKFL